MKFLDHLTFGQYVPADSLIHRADPRSKILSTVVLLTGVFLVKHPAAFVVWGLFLLSLTLLSRLSVRMVLGSAKPVMILVLFTSFIHFFLTAGEPLVRIWIFKITYEGLEMGIYMGLRLLFLVLFASVLTLTTSPMELADGLESLFSPLKPLGFPAHELAMMMTIALRFIPTLLDETDRIMKAQLARGADLDKGSILKRLKAFIPVLIPLFVIVFQRADDLAIAMEARCYKGGQGRTRMHPLVWEARDTICIFSVIAVVMFLTLVDRGLFL